MRTTFVIRGVCTGSVILILIFSIKSWISAVDDDQVPLVQALSTGSVDMELYVQLEKTKPRLKLTQKIVHLDFKGMPPRISYLAQLFPLFHDLGVTGILVEYEDMFPYHGPLAVVANRKAYSPKEITELNDLAAQNQLVVIPLIQTFGHLEFVLKVEEFVELREVSRYPQVLCPSNNRSLDLVKMMVDQVLALHPQVTHVHIGSDEVYYLGQCSRCISRMSHMPSRTSEYPKAELFLSHVKTVAEHVTFVHKKRAMMWDDEFRQLEDHVVLASGLGDLVDIVVWNYRPDVATILEPSLWAKYKRTFPSIWIGSAFKGANRPDSMIVNENNYLANHYSWIRTLEREQDIGVHGIILTGWQRYDHFSVLCEILSVAIPSLVACLTFLRHPVELSFEGTFEVSRNYLQCQSPLGYCHYPGSDTYDQVQKLHNLKAEFEHIKNQSYFRGWAHGRVNLQLGFSSPSHMELLLDDLTRVEMQLTSARQSLEHSLALLYPQWSVTEFLVTNLDPMVEEIQTIGAALREIMDRRTFPVRPFLNDSKHVPGES